MVAFLRSEGVTITEGNRVCLLKSGEEKFDDLFVAIRKAKHYIHLEYFNFRNDSIAALLFTELDKKVQEGVKVRAMFDAFGNWSNNKPLKKKHLKELAKRGIEIVKFDPLNFPFIGDFMSRDHRKIVIIDGQTAYTGGMNVADYYIERYLNKRLYEDITYPQSMGQTFFALPDNSYFYQDEENLLLFGEAYRLQDGVLEKICETDECLDMADFA